MEISLLFEIALLYGGLLSLILGCLMWISFLITPDIWVGDYPPDIQEAYGPMSAKGKKWRPFIGILFFGTIIAGEFLAFNALRNTAPVKPGYMDYFLTGFAVLMIFNIFDLFIADWLIFVAIQPKQIVLPGTEGLAGYNDYGFHFRGFLMGILFSGVSAAILSGIALVIGNILS
jgi:hypothetical protein